MDGCMDQTELVEFPEKTCSKQRSVGRAPEIEQAAPNYMGMD